MAGSGLKGYTGRMEFTDFMLLKAIAIVVLAFFAGLFGFIDQGGQEPKEGRGKRPE